MMKLKKNLKKKINQSQKKKRSMSIKYERRKNEGV
jgi:hypothetical protein